MRALILVLLVVGCGEEKSCLGLRVKIDGCVKAPLERDYCRP